MRHDGHEMPDLFGSLGQIFDNVTDLLYFSKFDIHLPESILDHFIFSLGSFGHLPTVSSLGGVQDSRRNHMGLEVLEYYPGFQTWVETKKPWRNCAPYDFPPRFLEFHLRDTQV